MALYGKSRTFNNVGIVNQDSTYTSILSDSLAQLGLHGKFFSNPYEMLNDYQDNWFNLIILNHCASQELTEMARWIGHQATSQTAILIWAPNVEVEMTNQPSDLVVISALEKPCTNISITTKINELLRGDPYRPTRGSKTDFGKYEFYISCCHVKVNEEWIPLTQKQFELALLLFKYQGQCVSKKWIASKIWGASLKDTSRTLDTHISVLRKKLHLHENGVWIMSVYGTGYQLFFDQEFVDEQASQDGVHV